jgi:ABC-type Fe3+-siderophore transport system permease subunit
MFGSGLTDVLLVLLIVVVIFGAKRLPLFGERPAGSAGQPAPWTRADWLLLVVAIVAVSVAVGLEILQIRAR